MVSKEYTSLLRTLLTSSMCVSLFSHLHTTTAETRGDCCRHCSEHLEHMAPVDRPARARKTVHIFSGTRDGARTRAVWTHLQCSVPWCTNAGANLPTLRTDRIKICKINGANFLPRGWPSRLSCTGEVLRMLHIQNY
jgi:hypothetical protein